MKYLNLKFGIENMPECKSNCFDALYYIGFVEVGGNTSEYCRYKIIKTGVDKVKKELKAKKYSNNMIWSVARIYKKIGDNVYRFRIPDRVYDEIVKKIYSLLDAVKQNALFNKGRGLNFCDPSLMAKEFLTVAPVPSGVIQSATSEYPYINKKLDVLRNKIK